MLQRIIAHRLFALADPLLVATSAVIWMLKPELGVGMILLAVLPWGLRLLSGRQPFRRSPYDWLVLVFVITAGVGYWAAYDSGAAWNKLWLIILGVLLYYALVGQPSENLGWVCSFLFCVGVTVSLYFLLTHDFVALPRKLEIANRLGEFIMSIRPNLTWTPVHPNYVAGMTAITTPFIIYPAGKLGGRKDSLSVFLRCCIGLGAITAILVFFMATSRGALMAVMAAAGAWIGWKVIGLSGSRLGFRREAVFPSLILLYLGAVAVFLYAGPANSGGVFADQYYYGTGSRAELLGRSLYLAMDFPITGGGLASFPGLYSYYMLGIPFFNVINSHNLFVDVAIEQGLLGGIAFLAIYLTSIWTAARRIAGTDSPRADIIHWLVLFGMIVAFVHGLVDDYLYNGIGTVFCLVLVGLAAMLHHERRAVAPRVGFRTSGLVAVGVAGLFILNFSAIRTTWYANRGAVEMTKVVLSDFPTNGWTDISVLPNLKSAEDLFHSTLQADPKNRTANHYLGLIFLLRRDFPSAASYLEAAHRRAPHHRGIMKALGYCYGWLGEVETGSDLLRQIPEAREELDAYIWWWGIQARDDLAENASLMSEKLDSKTSP